MNTESEPMSGFEGEAESVGRVSSIPEGFYNPEKERLPVSRTEASRALTKLVDILIPGAVSTEGVDSRHQIDAVTVEYQEALVPTTTGKHKEEFMVAISPLLTRLEAIGFGDYRANPYLKNIEAFTANEKDEIVFEGLYSPWQYSPDGRAISTIDRNKLKVAVEALSEETEAEQERKVQAETYLEQLDFLMTEELAAPKETLIERLDEPNLEQINTIRETLDLFSEEMIALVGAITDGKVALADTNRTFMKNATAPLMVLMKSLRKNTKIGADNNRVLYPEFWQLLDKYHTINCAIGIVNTIKNDVRHELSYPTV